MTKKELALIVIDLLKKEYPDSGCSLEYEEPWKLLVSVRLAAQCTDARVNIVRNTEIDTSLSYDLLMNACPVGMYPRIEGCPVNDEVIDKTV